jgi:putative oxidoreductase
MIPAENRKDLGILILRVLVPGTLFFGHGLAKLSSIPAIFGKFPDPIGLGSTLSAILVMFAEGPCAIAVMLGLWTRLAVLPIIIAMTVVVFIFNATDPFAAKEKALLFLIVHLALFVTGGGRYVLNRKFLADKR